MSTKTKQALGKEAFLAEAEELLKPSKKIAHADVLEEILNAIEPVDFRKVTGLASNEKIGEKHYRIVTISEILRIAHSLNCGLCKSHGLIYTHNGEYWSQEDRDKVESFLGRAAEKLSVGRFTAQDYEFKAKLHKQFMADAHLPRPESDTSRVLINLQNGTFDLTPDKIKMREFRREDFLTYQLPFAFDKAATCPKWRAFLDEVLPDPEKQRLLAEYIAYVFARNLKLEKTLILFGTGANGKSVIFDIINALLGKENVSNFSLESLGEPYYRAMIADKLLNYASEISNRLQSEKFKLLTSGEPIEARLPYGQPMTLVNYARLAFNCNELPKDVEHTEAFFRRFLILTFDITIPAERRNPNLAREIIRDELSGIFNWMLEGLRRLLEQNNFSRCLAVEKALDEYRRESDSVAMFLEEEQYQPTTEEYTPLKKLYPLYRIFCKENGYLPVGNNNFSKRLEAHGIVLKKTNIGKVAYVSAYDAP